jgi:N-acyl-L-homoserine lactone synthetase
MRVVALTPQNYDENAGLLLSMHQLRNRVFKGRLGWDVDATNDMEIDDYDALGPVYLLIVAGRNQVVASVRLLPTTGPTMLANTFSELLAGHALPRDKGLLESSRFCVDTQVSEKAAAGGLHKTTFMLLSAVLEWGLLTGAKGIVTVTDLRMERILRRAGWPLSRVGEPKVIGATTALAGILPVTLEAADCIRLAGGLNEYVFLSSSPLAA